jgi:hypothetical protein
MGRLSEAKRDQEKGRLDIHLDFPPGTQFTHPTSGEPAPIYDTRGRTWRHWNFFQYECYLHAWVQRVGGGEESGTKTVEVAWARPGSGFTRLTNIPAEDVNGPSQTAKRNSRGFRSVNYFRVMIHLIGSKLNFNHLPSPVPFDPLRSTQRLKTGRSEIRQRYQPLFVFQSLPKASRFRRRRNHRVLTPRSR